jgi:glutamine synthetase
MAEYVWIGGTGADMRCKSRTLDKIPKSPADLPKWNYDGSSCGQAPGDDSEVFLIPRAIYRDPFRGGDNILVMCDAYEPPKAGQECKKERGSFLRERKKERGERKK